MKKRVLAIAMSLAMTLSLLPVSALAAEEIETPIQKEVTSTNQTEEEVATVTDYVAQVGNTQYTTLEAAFGAAKDGDTITLINDAILSTTIYVHCDGDIIFDMNGKTVSLGATETDGGTIIFSGNSNVTISGNGTVDFNDSYLTGNSSGRMFEVEQNATLTIENGTFEAGLTCVLADHNATVNIMGGYYSAYASYSNKYWILNRQDGTQTRYFAYGGTFKNYDPSNSDTENPTDNFCADGYVSVQDGENYVVKPIADVAVAQVGDTYYLTLAEAIENASNNQTVTLLSDVRGNDTTLLVKDQQALAGNRPPIRHL